ncbi:hypothetical protein FHS76_000348 [Ochrobactrum daejeonense]|uniref:Uncharacterized protein n=1 Tax=Brucella daejeonensis TaxID=659015 RepID=A0A7W9ATW5_9HYPH|nr:hypothetical protein [Brucella daejeonensis]MBB5700510.1 hypothetical protein [Brucella daejeonensis]
MPTLTRLVIFLALVAAVIYGAMYALANFVEPDMREITVEIPASKLKPVVIPPPPAAEPAAADASTPSDTPQE